MMKRVKMLCVLLAFGVLAANGVMADDPAPFGAMGTFDLDEVSTTVVPIIFKVVTIMGAVLGAGFAIVVLRWGYRKVVGMLK